MSDNEKTSLYGNSDKNRFKTDQVDDTQKTSLYSNGQDLTSAYSDDRKSEIRLSTHGLQSGDKLSLKGKEYKITDIVSEGTGEAVIYKITDQNNDIFVLKLYFEFKNPKEEPNSETLERISQINDPDILKLYDFGVGAGKYKGKYCYEISDFAEGGDLFSIPEFRKKYTPEFIEKTVVKELFNGIRNLHDYKIYHCDLKPSNIFYKDLNQTDILIGDYGSSVAFNYEEDKMMERISNVKGTQAYIAPEQANGMVSEKNDYYSLGMILLHLLYPDQFADDNNLSRVSREKFKKIAERQYDSRPIITFNPEYRRLNNLIEGLTLINHVNRFGKADLEKWFNGEEIEVRYRNTEVISVQYVKLKDVTIKTESDFIKVLDKSESWWEDIFEDPDTYQALKGWVGSYKDIPTRKLFDGMIQLYLPYGKDFVREAAVRFFKADRDLRIDMATFNFFTAKTIEKEVEAYISKLDEIWKITPIARLRFYIFQLEFSLRQLKKSSSGDKGMVAGALIEKIYSVFGLMQKPFDDFKTEIQSKISLNDEPGIYRPLIRLFYAFNPKRTFRDSYNNSIKTLNELGLFYVRDKATFQDKYLRLEKDAWFEQLKRKDLESLDYKELIFEIFKDKAEAQVELTDLTFDKHRDYKIKYKYFKSLNAFLARNKIPIDFSSRSAQSEHYENRRGFFQTFDSECTNFITTVSLKHNIPSLTPENLAQIRKKFSVDSWKRILYIYSGPLVALLAALPLIFLLTGIFTHKIDVTIYFSDSGRNAKAPAQATVSPYFRVRSNANIRSGPSESSPVIGLAYKDNMVQILDASNPKWYRVNSQNTVGYISAALLLNPNSPYVPAQNVPPARASAGTSPVQPPSGDGISAQPVKTTNGPESPAVPVKTLKWVVCPDCSGHGHIDKEETCSLCGGLGELVCPVCNGQTKVICSNCEGKGKKICTSCKGNGYLVCSICGGRKYLICSTCKGSGSNGNRQCFTCRGTGRLPCFACRSTGQTPCFPCNHTGYVQCFTCNRTGYVPCNTCQRTGKVKCKTCLGKGQVVSSETCIRCNGKGQIQIEI